MESGQTSIPGQVHRAHVRNHLALRVIELDKNAAGKRGDLGIWDENCAFRRGRPRVAAVLLGAGGDGTTDLASRRRAPSRG